MKLLPFLLTLALLTPLQSPYHTHNDRFAPPRLTTLDAWKARADYVRAHVLTSAGLLPMPEKPPLSASIVSQAHHEWQDGEWMRSRASLGAWLDKPMAIYEVHLGSWQRVPDDNRYLTYAELAERLIPYMKHMGYSHIELLPVHGAIKSSACSRRPAALGRPRRSRRSSTPAIGTASA